MCANGYSHLAIYASSCVCLLQYAIPPPMALPQVSLYSHLLYGCARQCLLHESIR